MNPTTAITNTRFVSPGFTLVEVMLALALTTSVLVSILVIRGRLVRQAAQAETIARANVLAGYLAGQWKNGQIACDAGQEQRGKDPATGYQWQLNCIQEEVESGVFLERLKVQVYTDRGGQEPTIAFDAWQPLK